MTLRAILLAAACCAAFALPAAGQTPSVRVAFADGRVTVIADNATLPEILREWARVGGSTFINAERIAPAERMTLRLANEPEGRALDVLLRPVIGYIAAPQTAAGAASSVGRVLIMPAPRPTTYPVTALRALPPNQAGAPAFNAARRLPGPPSPDDDGPVRVEMPPVLRADDDVNAYTEDRERAATPAPNTNTNIRMNPGLGIPTSTQPGVVITTEPGRPGGTRVPAPPKPKPGGGGG